jgi:hypothetical protein
MRITREDYIKAHKRAARVEKHHFTHKIHKSIKDYDRTKHKITIKNYEQWDYV